MKPQFKVTLIAVIIVGAAIVFMAVTTGGVGTVTTTDTGVTKVFAKVNADSTASIPIGLTEGSGVEHESEHVFDAVQFLPGVKEATILMDGSAIEVAYASGEVSEADIKAALASAGYAEQQEQ